MNLAVETEQETDGRWIAEIPQLPGALAYGSDHREAISRVEALALRVLADRIEHGEMPQPMNRYSQFLPPASTGQMKVFFV